MNYDDIEALVILAKAGDAKAKELLAREFTPLILKLSGKSFIHSYEFSDVRNECFRILFKCVRMYDGHRHRFVAYATNAIKNSINHLIRVSVRRSRTEGPGALILDGQLENTLACDIDEMEEFIFSEAYKKRLKPALERLNAVEKDLVVHVYARHYSIKNYSLLKGIPYYTAVRRKNSILKKLKKDLLVQPDCRFKN